MLRAIFGRVSALDVEAPRVVRSQKLSRLEEQVLELLPQEADQFILERDDGSLTGDDGGAGPGAQLARLGKAPSVSTLVELRAQLMMQGRLR